MNGRNEKIPSANSQLSESTGNHLAIIDGVTALPEMSVQQSPGFSARRGYAKGFAKVWFARRIEIANWCLEKGY